MKINLQDNGYKQQAELLLRTIAERIPVQQAEDGMSIVLEVNHLIGKEESFQIYKEDDNWNIVGADEAGLYYGIGKFLHTATWNEESFVPQETAGVVTPDCDFRATYYSIHFYNWYYTAPTEELKKYTEELMLWGYNTIICIIPLVNFNSCDSYYTDVHKEPLKIETNGYSIKHQDVHSLCVLGANSGISFTMTKSNYSPESNNGRTMIITDNGEKNNYNKMYFVFAQNEDVSSGEVWNATTTYQIKCK